MISRLAFAVLTLVTLGACTSIRDASQSASRVDGAKISETLKGFVDNGSLVGVSALVTKNGKEAVQPLPPALADRLAPWPP